MSEVQMSRTIMESQSHIQSAMEVTQRSSRSLDKRRRHSRESSTTDPSDSVRSVEVQRRRRKTKHKRKHHHHHHQKEEYIPPVFDVIPGVGHVILTEEVQHLLKCVVGEDVTAEKPWKHLNKFYITEQVESEDVPPEYQTFLPFKQEIIAFPNDEILFGYIPNEVREYDEYYICLSLEAEEQVAEAVKEEEAKQQARLDNTINKRVGVWTTLGSEADVEDAWMVNTRGLFQIEFEAKYPIISPDVQFRFRMVDDARDGYAELMVLPRYLQPILHKRRIEIAMQISPAYRNNDAQTFCGYPKNAWTQYEYYVDFIDNLSREWMANFKYFIEATMPEFTDTLNVNGYINFYTNDYMDLRDKDRPVILDSEYREYNSFDDVKRCMGKVISTLSWHPMWTGVVAIAYVDISPKWYKTQASEENVMANIVHGYNPVLIWSFKDSLYPRLVLETNSEVHCLAFCPHDPNLLIGGCMNGQIILWDIKNKLTKVETEEILSPAQQAYRARMNNEMSWMKNTRDYSLVPPTAYSQLLDSHLNNITGLEWVHPLYKIARTGHIEPLNEAEEYSLQFLSSSSDGTIKFWDLRQKVIFSGDYKPVRKSRRLPHRPSALTMDVSPYRLLNRRMIPHFQVNVIDPWYEKMCPVSSLSILTDCLKYEEENPDPNRLTSFTDRIIYQPINELPRKPAQPVITLGTYAGDFLLVNWEGYEYSSGEEYSKEDAKFLTIAKYHDGPVLTIKRHPILEDVYLSVGGKIFCIWVTRLKEKPLLWRRSRYKYTHGNWETGRAACFWFTTSDGSREFWNLDFKSDSPYTEMTYSGKPLMCSELHPLPMREAGEKMFGIADDRGALRLIYYNTVKIEDDEELSSFRKFVKNNADRASDLESWQTKWLEKHASWIKEKAAQGVAEQARLREEELARQAYEEEQRAREAQELAKMDAAKFTAPPGKYEEWATERWIVKEQERMGYELLTNKRLDKETLVKQQAPLKKLEAEAARKQQKIKARLAKVDEIFNATLAMLFPDLVERPKTEYTTTINYTEQQRDSMENQFITAYADMEDELISIVENNPFVYDLEWKNIILSTRTKRMAEEYKYYDRHSERHKRYKMHRESGDFSVIFRKESEEWVTGEQNQEDDNSDSEMVYTEVF